MTLEELNTAAAVGTFLVITATAVAAVIQLRHIRLSNQLSGMLAVFGLLQNPSTRDLINYVRHDLGERMTDEAFRASLLQTPIDRKMHPEMYLCDIYQHVGSFVRSGLIDEKTYLQTDWYNVTLYWSLLSETIRISRTKRPHTFENFEYLASRAQAWAAAHPDGDYPPGAARAAG